MTSAALEKLAESASPTMKENIQRALTAAEKLLEQTLSPPAPVTGKVSIRVPRPRKVPLTEIEYEAILKQEFPDCRVIHEGIAFRLPSGSRYIPDFTVWSADRLRLIVETKGWKRLLSAARSHEAFKTLITQFPDIRHRFAQKQEDGQWATKDYNFKA